MLQRDLLRLAIWRDESFIKEEIFLPLIGMIICLWEGSLVVILMCGLVLFEPFMILLTWSIFWALREGNISLIFKTSEVLTEVFEACTYDLPKLTLLLWVELLTVDFLGLKYLEIVLTSFLVLAGRGRGGGTLLIVTGTGFTISFLLMLLGGIVLGVNFDDTFVLRVFDLLSVNKLSHLAS